MVSNASSALDESSFHVCSFSSLLAHAWLGQNHPNWPVLVANCERGQTLINTLQGLAFKSQAAVQIVCSRSDATACSKESFVILSFLKIGKLREQFRSRYYTIQIPASPVCYIIASSRNHSQGFEISRGLFFVKENSNISLNFQRLGVQLATNNLKLDKEL